MTVTSVTKINNSRYKICLDTGTVFALYPGEIRRLGIKEGSDLKEDTYDKIMTEILPVRAKRRILNLISVKDYSVQKLTEKLKEGLYPSFIIEDSIDYVIGLGYVDDLRYAFNFIMANANLKTESAIRQKLILRGITSLTVDKAFDEWRNLGNEQDYEGMLEDLLRKRSYNSQTATDTEKRRNYNFLIRKGFPHNMVMDRICNFKC
ncbi:MAG: recombination regulator RecX [Lachnospiraceae bacterium]|nr:recombination regulator RecX [Lachnospiraceae bacterium]